jgi:hypothetical protein
MKTAATTSRSAPLVPDTDGPTDFASVGRPVTREDGAVANGVPTPTPTSGIGKSLLADIQGGLPPFDRFAPGFSYRKGHDHSSIRGFHLPRLQSSSGDEAHPTLLITRIRGPEARGYPRERKGRF